MKPPDPYVRLVQALSRMPGVGRRSADRIAMGLLKDRSALLKEVMAAMTDADARLTQCKTCGCLALSSTGLCDICNDNRREGQLLCVVRSSADVFTLEKAGGFNGRYHVLPGIIAPMDGETLPAAAVDALVRRIDQEKVTEVLIALDSDVEGDATAAYLRDALERRPVKISRLARGLPTGAGVAYADSTTLGQAIRNRSAW